MRDDECPDTPDEETNAKSLHCTRRNLMKLSGAGALTALGVSSVGVGSAAVTEGGPANQDEWTLTFEDDFDGDSLDTEQWSIGWGWGTGTTMSPTEVVERNVDVRDSNLYLKGTHDGDQPYAGGVNTKNKVTFGPGSYYEAKIKFARREGFQNAFWSKPNTEAWPPEIDVVELMQDGSGTDDTHRSRHHIHYSTSTEPGDNSTHVGPGGGYTPGDDLTENYHIYGVEWQEDRITHYVDGEAVWESTDSTAMQAMQNGGVHYMMFSLNIDNVGTPDYSVPWGEEVAIDWVRLWDHSGTSSDSSTTDSTTDTTSQTDTEHYLWARSGDGNPVTFAFEASGGNIGIEPQDTTEDYWVAEDGTVAGGTTSKTSSLPGFRFTGDITDLRFDGDLDIYIDNSPVNTADLVDDSEPGPYKPSDQSQTSDSTQTTTLPNTITIDGSGYSSSTSYTVSVSDALAETDSITSEDSVSGTTASGAVGAGSDTYRFEGDVTDIALDGPADVYVNESRVDLLVIRRGSNSNGTVWYLVETDGAVQKAETSSGVADSGDDVGNSKIHGSVKDDSDAYWLFDGSVLDVSTYGGDVVATLNGQEL
ncbi:family 16 glycosylhydrolase [Haloferax sp. ATB1]|uniref:glycoside hydrolase family 16 protein n=1 Tax=Haloferax sp. ATB1 TaxID=1508454 RepID=UPI0005B2296C|nr:glycoside hydrolase family 16 protein [Haloferax sp. ATB1]